MPTLQDKVIIVTGSSTGIGKAIAIACVAAGARVVVHGRNAPACAALVAQLGADKAIAHVEDLSVDGCPQRLVATAISTFGQLHGVVNNAAFIGAGNIHDIRRRFVHENDRSE